MFILNRFVIILTVCGVELSAKILTPIGAIFEQDNVDAELAFQSIIFRENMYNENIEFVPKVVKLSTSDSFAVEKQVCELLSEGVVAIFGPSNVHANGIVGSMCDTFHIPHFTTNWMISENLNVESHKFTRNFFPESNMYSRALAEIVVNFGWTSFTILYDNNDALMRLQDVLQINGPDDTPITVRKLDDNMDFRPLLKEIHKSGETHIIIDCAISNILELLRQANDVKMMEEYQNYFITTTDTHVLDFAELKFVRANVTAIRLIDPSAFESTSAVQDWNQNSFRNKNTKLYLTENIQTESGLLHDSVKMFSSVIKEFDGLAPAPIKCNGNNDWSQGEDVMKSFDERTENGITGRILFDEKGLRSHFTMEVLEMSQDGWRKVAYWDSTEGVVLTRDLSEVYSQISQSLHNKTVIVVTRLGMPFFGLKTPEDGEVLEGNDRYHGYSVDLIDGIAKILGFKYEFTLEPYNLYGAYNKETKKWDGLVKQLLDRKADMAICDLTITYQRRTAVDFTTPFMTLGISILFAKPIKQPPDLFSFLSPLSLDVWLYMGSAYLGISLSLYVLARSAPDDWESPHPCETDPEEVENVWSLLNCTWLSIGSIMGQGCDLLPKSISTRLVTGSWWFFALILLSSYTANLAAFLTKEQMDVSIESAEDLAKQSKIKYGAVLGGSTLSFFKESKFPLYQRIWSAMESAEPSVFVGNNKEGEDRVVKSKRLYAFFMESSSIEYIVERNCNVTQIGGLLDSKGYGIAMPVNSPYRTHVSHTVLKMQEEGKLHRLKTKWWKEVDGGNCEADVASASEGAAELGIGNVGGVFVILILGCVSALILGIAEFLWNVKDLAIEEKISLWEALKMELLFAFNFSITTKPVFSNPSKSPSPSEDIEDSHQSSDTLNTISKSKN